MMTAGNSSPFDLCMVITMTASAPDTISMGYEVSDSISSSMIVTRSEIVSREFLWAVDRIVVMACVTSLSRPYHPNIEDMRSVILRRFLSRTLRWSTISAGTAASSSVVLLMSIIEYPRSAMIGTRPHLSFLLAR